MAKLFLEWIRVFAELLVAVVDKFVCYQSVSLGFIFWSKQVRKFGYMAMVYASYYLAVRLQPHSYGL